MNSLSPTKTFLRRITQGNQITLPQSFIKDHQLHVGDSVEIIREENRLIIQLVPQLQGNHKNAIIEKLKVLLDNTPDLDENEEALLSSIENERIETHQDL